MEAIQTCQYSHEVISELGPQSSMERVKSRLARIPNTPSELSSPKPESAVSFSTITTAKTTTEALAGTSTAATSLLSLPEVFTVQKFHVSPKMPIDEKVQAVWTRQVRSRFSAVLLHNIPKGTCVQEFMMVGKRSDALKPTLIITCGDAITKKRVEKTFKSQGWLQELLKTNGIMFIALVAKTPLSAGPATNSTGPLKMEKYYAVQLLPSGATTSCGKALLVMDTHAPQHCTLGGLLMVNGEILGLTARHPFEAYEADHTSVKLYLPDMAHDTKHIDNDESSEMSNEPFIFNDDDDDASDTSNVSPISFQEDADVSSTSISGPFYGQTDSLNAFSSKDWIVSQFAIVPRCTPTDTSYINEPLEDYDWALLETLPPSVKTRPNKIAHINPRHDILIEEVASQLVDGEVTVIIASIGPQLGYLHSSPVTMKVEKAVLNVRLITLERALRKFSLN